MNWQDPSPGLDRDACGIGFVTRLGAPSSREIVDRALVALDRLSHRGAVDAEGTSGDGAGLMTAIPEEFFRRDLLEIGVELPARFAVGMVFLRDGSEVEARQLIEAFAQDAGLNFLGWRDVPINSGVLGGQALQFMPRIQQLFLAAAQTNADLELQLFLYRKRVESLAPRGTYFCSLSSRTVVYKGLLSPSQLASFYPDLMRPEYRSSFAVFHQRFSTNTRPTWSLAQPFRFVGHNGEINTISGNRRWTRSREGETRAQLGAGEWFRSLEKHVSDSASFDNGFEGQMRRGFSPAEGMMRMVPPAWEGDDTLSDEMRGWLAQQAWQQEPWDGPAALVFSDGAYVGAKLDRNGLRPLRYVISKDGLVLAGSEAGLTDLEEDEIQERSRLGPGEMLLAEIESGKLWRGNEVASLLCSTNPTQSTTRWITASVQRAKVEESKVGAERTREAGTDAVKAEKLETLKIMAAALGWSEDQFRLLFRPLGVDGKEAVWSMGDDAPPAYLSHLRRNVWDYCKQRFAQVTNPPIDPIREAHVMSLNVYLGGRIGLRSPIVDSKQMNMLRRKLGQVTELDITFDVSGGVTAALSALESIQQKAAQAAANSGVLVVSDRSVNSQRSALPGLLAAAAAANGILQSGRNIPLLVETGQAFDAHHLAVLVAVGAAAVHPYLALDLAGELATGGVASFRSALEVGLRKVLARMGISALSSYRNSHLFEVIGLDRGIHEKFFGDAAFILPGKSLAEVLEDALMNHASAFKTAKSDSALRDRGYFRFRKDGERHASSPELVRAMHSFIKSGKKEAFEAYAQLGGIREPVALRDLLEFVPATESAGANLDEVESEGAILRRLSTQAMSLGAISPEAHRTIALAMNQIGARSNTGEGGEDPELYRREPGASNKVKQVASGRFGVTAEYLVHAEEIEIKMAQGSKPGEGGQLPSFKVTPYIAQLRHVVTGTSLISPPPHHDIYSIEDLAQLIHDLRAINPVARIGVKLVSGAGVGIIAVGVAKAGADVITISGHDGGTGASPLTSIKNTGLPWEVGLREAHCELARAGLRSRVRLRVDGGLKFGRDVAIAALLGADEFGFGTAALLAIGCVMARQCHLNTCPVGIATQDEQLRMRFNGKPEMVVAYFRGVAAEVRSHLSKLGLRSLAEATGRVDLLKEKEDRYSHSVRPLLETPEISSRLLSADVSGRAQAGEYRRLDDVLVRRGKSQVNHITNADRSVGARLSGELLRLGGTVARAGSARGSKERICRFRGVAGQSFGTFLTKDVSFHLEGEANDYVGKGMCGGRIVVTAGPEASLRGDVLVGNTVLYGATSGELYVAGRAGERFAVRNSGALAVVEGTGQHACEYMTAGVVLALGPVGINFGSGMTGGLSYVLREHLPAGVWNAQSVALAAMEEEEQGWLQQALAQHWRLTGSPVAHRLWMKSPGQLFARVQPIVLPCAVSQTWAPILEGLNKAEKHGEQVVVVGRPPIGETPWPVSAAPGPKPRPQDLIPVLDSPRIPL
jgi:glutamate synthase (ferredoxin)